MNRDTQSKVSGRLNRIAGQVAGLQKMVQEDRYCVDILTQLAAVRSALDAVGVELLTRHLQNCVAGCHPEPSAHPEARNKPREELVEEVKRTLSRFLR
jgi:DNA-binding FrmR family transcriptional regulator